MRIGIDARMWGEGQTGIGLYVENLVRHLLEIDKKNQYVLFLRKDYFSALEFSQKNVEKVLADYKWYSYNEQFYFPALLKKMNLDVLHFPNFNIPIFYNGKKVVTIHDLTTHKFAGHYRKRWWRELAFRTVFARAIKNSDKIIAVSRFTKNEILKQYGVSDSKIEVIYSGLPNKNHESRITNHKNDPEILLSKYEINKPYIFFTGVWRKHKNLINLIRAFKILREEYKQDILLVLGGQEEQFYNEPRKEWQKLELEEFVITPGFIIKEELPSFFSGASVFVFPSFSEGFGFAPLEAGSYGVSCVVSDIGALRESCGEAVGGECREALQGDGPQGSGKRFLHRA